jgi:hypothetical protein
MRMQSSLQYLPAVPLTLLQLLVPETPQHPLQSADFPTVHTLRKLSDHLSLLAEAVPAVSFRLCTLLFHGGE